MIQSRVTMIIHTKTLRFKHYLAIFLQFSPFLVLFSPISASARGFRLEGTTESFAIRGPIIEDEDISGIARGEDHIGIIVSDEGSVIQSLAFLPDGSGASIRAAIDLAPGAKDELDAEGSTYYNGKFYVTGSHGVSRKKGKLQASRYGVFRFGVGPEGRGATGLQRASLGGVLGGDPVLGAYHQKPLQERGLNIEGLAAKEGQLYFGLRAPNIDGDSFVIEVGADALFGSDSPKYERHALALGAGLGIRDLAATDDGFLLIAGNAGPDSSDDFPETTDHIKGLGYTLFFWRPGSDPVAVGKLPDVGAKAEALLVLEESAESIEILILSDGIAGGAPLRLTVVKS
ncbi:hypothetical protein BH23VER1_BH23VER1_15400 [soil metagenome]